MSGQFIPMYWALVLTIDGFEVQSLLNFPSGMVCKVRPAGDALRKVRLRAFAGNAVLVGTIPSTKAAFFDAIVKERAWELASEGHRKYDLIRWNMLTQKIA